MFRAIWTVIVSTLAAAAVGCVYDYFRPALLDATRGSGAEAWFSSGNSMYLMPWLFAIAGLISSIIAVLMSGAGKRTIQAVPAPVKKEHVPQPAGNKPAVKTKAGEEAVPGMPGFDFDKALAEIKTETPGAPATGEIPASVPPAAVEPPQEAAK